MAGIMGHVINSVFFFKGSYNAQVNCGENEPADSAIRRFRKAVMGADVLPEVRRRRYFEDSQDVRKRKEQQSHRRKIRPRTFQQAQKANAGPFERGARPNFGAGPGDISALAPAAGAAAAAASAAEVFAVAP